MRLDVILLCLSWMISVTIWAKSIDYRVRNFHRKGACRFFCVGDGVGIHFRADFLSPVATCCGRGILSWGFFTIVEYETWIYRVLVKRASEFFSQFPPPCFPYTQKNTFWSKPLFLLAVTYRQNIFLQQGEKALWNNYILLVQSNILFSLKKLPTKKLLGPTRGFFWVYDH